VKRVDNFSKEIAEEIVPLGIVITKFQANSTIHVNVSKNLRKDPDVPEVFETVIPQGNQIAAAAEFQAGTRRTLKQKYGYDGLAERYFDLAKEVLAQLEVDA
jgi:chromosome partitioning protein